MSAKLGSSRRARPRRMRWTPPVVGTRFIRSEDQAVHVCANVYRRDQQVQLRPADGGRPVYVWAWELEAAWEQVVL